MKNQRKKQALHLTRSVERSVVDRVSKLKAEKLEPPKTLTVERRDYLVLAQFAHKLYKLMIENPYEDPSDLANVMMNDMFAKFLDATQTATKSSVQPKSFKSGRQN